MDVVITNPRNAVSAVRLGLPVITAIPTNNNYNNIINWGRSDAPDNDNVINKGCYVSRTVNKDGYLHDLEDNHIPVPAIRDAGDALQDRSWVIRPNVHEEGREFNLHNVEVDGTIRVPEDHHATLFISPTREYRIWFAGNSHKTAKRTPRPSEDETDESCRSKWGYRNCDNFPGAIELVKKARAVVPIQFGAFDLLWATEERKWYILEVNSAPSLDTDSVRAFMAAGIKALMRPEPTIAATPRPAVATPLPQVIRRRLKVITMEGWQEIEV